MGKHKSLITLFLFILFAAAGCLLGFRPHGTPPPAAEGLPDNLPASGTISPENYNVGEEISEEARKRYLESKKFRYWLEDSITKDFLMGKINRSTHHLFAKLTEEHTERNIYLLKPVYEAYIKMYEAALTDGVRLIVTSGHRTFVEQVCEWELRWNNPRTEYSFADETEKARFVLQYRSMPGTSRHHWGTDIDLNSFNLSYFETAEGEKLYNWLSANAHLYGFFQPYTVQDENRPKGYCEEKWHWSYRPVARPMLEHYLRKVGKEDITGFKGDRAAGHLSIIKEWVCGIDQKLIGNHTPD
ncbi:MAG: M15 family metallopeptidase [Tannerellaceae bacterium]|jgi:LAS superfamily LD-carboxypeptidase LdcB|nr:M15 family metallopeptidase [Tannerellaceae bacterium]